MNRRKVVAAIPSVRFDVCRGQGVVNTDAAEHELQTGAATRRRGGKRMHNQLGAHAAGAVDSAGGAEAKPKVDTTVTVLSAMDGREDIAQMARRLAADVAALSREPEVGQREQGSPKVDEELVSAQLRGNPALHCFGLYHTYFLPVLRPLPPAPSVSACVCVCVSACLSVCVHARVCACTCVYCRSLAADCIYCLSWFHRSIQYFHKWRWCPICTRD